MAYNPFASSEDTDSQMRRFTKPPRWPPIFETKLSSLEWSKAEGTRKRQRPSPDASRRRPESHRSDSAPAPAPSLDRRRPPPPADAPAVAPIGLPPGGLTIMGVPPVLDDRIRTVMNFMLAHVHAPDVEVEAKLGTIFEKGTNAKAASVMPVQCSTPVHESVNNDVRFESGVHTSVFQFLNGALNRRVNETAAAAGGAHAGGGRVEYTRTKEVDVIWPGRVRETRVADAVAGGDAYRTERVQTKRRIADMNCICPAGQFDVRYSASQERDAQLPEGGRPMKQRVKDRISYKFEYVSVDITMVRLEENGQEKLTHEVEIEVEDANLLYREVCKYKNSDQSSKLCAIASSLVHTVNIILEEIDTEMRRAGGQQQNGR